ncbi:DUF4417 domain-containing protein [Bifidobacterium jacchi]|uniref:DUF4417 domain-containing protein n=1 Tax=Bifidobacterium jacchi TaxID=2490545 RepID=A0A5N5RL14_9BIFI|nr:DUF4417 domain-containing protein [Bifidobacterium jacchi]KAB5607630.1 DUF4417 domain-containing protein [Bifidobacterium jacchi]
MAGGSVRRIHKNMQYEESNMIPLFDMPATPKPKSTTPIWDDLPDCFWEGVELRGDYDMPRIQGIQIDMDRIKDLVAFNKTRHSDISKSFIHFFLHDIHFKVLLSHPQRYLQLFNSAAGILSPDFSLYRNAPLWMQERNCAYNRLVGRYYQRHGITTVATVRWGNEKSFAFCFDGIDKGSTVAIGTHGCIRTKEDRHMFMLGLRELFRVVGPCLVIVYGDMPEEVFAPFIKEYGPQRFLHFTSDIRKTHMITSAKGEN